MVTVHTPFRKYERGHFFPKYKRVPGEGPLPAKILLIGERPGENEARRGRPFIGKAGEILNTCLNAAALKRSQIYVTNLVKTFSQYGKPTEEEINRDAEELMTEIIECEPEIIGMLGTYTVESLMRVPRAEMDRTHGVPQWWTTPEGRRVIALPMYHPAAALYSNTMPIVLDDFLTLAAIDAGEITVKEDVYAGKEKYEEWQGGFYTRTPAAVDTEGSRSRPWCITFAQQYGSAYMVRRVSPESAFGDRVYLHNSLHDLGVLRSMGIELGDNQFTDTMVLAYHLCTEPQGLKELSYRHSAMVMHSYNDLIREPNKRKAVEFLSTVAEADWPDPPPYSVIEKGIVKIKRPHNIKRLAKRALDDIASGKVDKNGDPPDLRKRWENWDDEVKSPVVEVMGDMPEATLDDVDYPTAMHYACRDADATLRLAPILEDKIRAFGLEKAVVLDHAVIPMVDRMQQAGIRLAGDEFWKGLQDRCLAQMGKAKYKIYKMTGADINPGSGDQVAALLYGQLGLTPPKLTDGGDRGSTDALSMESLLADAPVVEPIMDYKEAQKIDGTYRRPLQRLAGLGDGRAHPTIRLTRTTTGRLSMADPPLHQIPAHTDLGAVVREGFIAAEGCCLGDWDLNQIEMRLMAHESQDRVLCQRFWDNADIHTETACDMFGVTVSQLSHNAKGKVNDWRRNVAKHAAFGIINGITEHGMVNYMILNRCKQADGSSWTEADCAEFIAEWFRIYKGVKNFQNNCVAEALQTGLSRESISGRMINLAAIWSPNKVLADTAARNSYVMHTQGGAAALLKRAMAVIWQQLKEVWKDYPQYRLEPVLQVHDELMFEMTDDPFLRNLWEGLVMDALTTTTKLRVPVLADGDFGHSWKEAH